MENRSHALAAGIFVLALSIAAALAGWYFSGQRESDYYLLETRGNVTGLNLQAQVRYRGIRAGKVERIDQDPADPHVLLVKISLDPRFRLTRASTAKLGYQGITGLAFVEIEDDGSSTELLPNDDEHPAHLALRPSLVETLGNRAGDIAAQVAELSQRLNRLLDDKNVANLGRTLENAAAASEGLKQVPQIVASLHALLSDENLKRVSAVLAKVDKTAGEATPLVAEAQQLVKTMNAASQKLDRLLGGGGAEVTANTLPQFNALLKQLTANSAQLGRVLQMIEERPQSLIFGRPSRKPGPGEAGFVAPAEAGQ